MGSQWTMERRLVPFYGVLSVALSATMCHGQQATLVAGVPLHVTVTHTVSMKVGAPVEGILTEPVYVHDRLVVPVGTVVAGSVSGLEAVRGEERTKALLNGDLTPLRQPVVSFTSMRLDGVVVSLDSEARVRQTETVRFAAQTHTSLRSQGETLVRDRVQSTREMLFAPGKMDRAKHLLYSQLPYHPQRLWQGEKMIADLRQPVDVEVARLEAPVAHLENAHFENAHLETAHLESAALTTSLPANVLVHARLVSTLDSDTAKRGDKAIAILTQPVFDDNQHLLLPEGAELEGEVLHAKRSRSFGRNGSLRFTFQGVTRPGEVEQKVHGIVTGAEGSQNQNLAVDAEGDVKAQPDKGRFLAPFLLLATAAGGHDEDGGLGQQTVASNGFGLVARGITLGVGSANVATGFGAYAFAKSVYFRFITRGHAVTFPKDTQVEVQLAQR